jgi:hypothetical protein
MIQCSFLVVCLVASTADDIAKKLEEAKAAYQASLDKNHAAVREWFDKRENAARQDGNKKLVDQNKADRVTYSETGELPKGAPIDLSRNFVDTNTAMEAAYLAAIKDYTRTKQDDQAATVEKQLETFKRSVRTWPRQDALGLDIFPEMLKAKFAADKVTFDKKTGILRLSYPFAHRKELKDFEYGEIEPKVIANSVVLNAGQTIKHIVEFDFVTVTGVIGLKEMRGWVLTTTGGTSLGMGGDNRDTMYLGAKGNRIPGKIMPVALRQGTIPFGFTVAEKRATVYWGNEQLGGESAEKAAGQLEFRGGDAGQAFGNLVISGKLNREWAKKFFTPTDK